MSFPTSRCVTEDWWSRWRYSIGFSRVTTCFLKVWLMYPIIAACVVVFPEPVAPVTRTRPRSSEQTWGMMGGRPSCSKVGMSTGMIRRTIMKDPRWRRMLTRNRPSPGIPHEQS